MQSPVLLQSFNRSAFSLKTSCKTAFTWLGSRPTVSQSDSPTPRQEQRRHSPFGRLTLLPVLPIRRSGKMAGLNAGLIKCFSKPKSQPSHSLRKLKANETVATHQVSGAAIAAVRSAIGVHAASRRRLILRQQGTS